MLELVALGLLGAHLGGEPARHLAHRRLTVLLGQVDLEPGHSLLEHAHLVSMEG